VATLPASNSFDGTAGVAITAANSGWPSGTAFDSLIGGGTGPPTFDATHPMHGSLSMMINYTGTAGTSQLAWTGLNQPTLWGRFYLIFAALPNITSRHLQLMTSGPGQSAALAFTSGGNLQWRAANNTGITGSTSTTVLSPLTQYRIEWSSTMGAGTGTVEWRLFAGDSTTALETNAQTGATLAAVNFDQVRLGSDSNPTTYQFWIDDPQVNATGFPGPSTQPGTPGTVVTSGMTY
jgi:hypothetical protein